MKARNTLFACPHCHRPYVIPDERNEATWLTCGRLLCEAKQSWTPARWHAAARMARTRRRAGQPLNPIDYEALKRNDTN